MEKNLKNSRKQHSNGGLQVPAEVLKPALHHKNSAPPNTQSKTNLQVTKKKMTQSKQSDNEVHRKLPRKRVTGVHKKYKIQMKKET